MPTFSYKAKKGPNEIVEGSIDAQNRDEAIRRVSALGFVPVRITEEGSGAVGAVGSGLRPDPMRPMRPMRPIEKGSGLRPDPTGGRGKTKGRTASFSFFSRIRSRDITLFTRQMATLFRSQVPILRALALLQDQSSNPKMKALVETVYHDVKDGRPLSEALRRYPRYFPVFFIAMMRSGEMSGRIEEILERLAQFREKDEELRMKIRGALAYPIFLVVVGAATILVLLTFVLPRLLVLFKEMDTELPIPTKMLMAASDFLSHNWPWIAGGTTLGAVIYLPQKALRRQAGIFFDHLKLRLPVAAYLARCADMERFCRTLSLLIRSGLPIVQSIETTVTTLENHSIRREFRSVGSEMAGGGTLSQALAKIPAFPRFVLQMIAVGEEGGRLEEILEESANGYALQVEQTTKILTSLVEPVLILVLGLIVGFIVAAMLLPIFQLNMAVQ